LLQKSLKKKYDQLEVEGINGALDFKKSLNDNVSIAKKGGGLSQQHAAESA
jgi:hypothetical protein